MRYFCMICLVAFSVSIDAQEDIKDNPDAETNISEVEIDNNTFNIEKSFYEIPIPRIPSVDKIKQYSNDSRFHYELPQEKKSDLESNWFTKAIGAVFGAIAKFFVWIFGSGILTFIVIVLIVFVVLVIVMKVAKIDLGLVFSRKKNGKVNENNILTNNSDDISFDELIRKALEACDFRLAVRYMYLRNLKALSDKNYIRWAENKTNYSYQNEIQNKDLRDRFLATTILFDYVWYGEFPIDESSYSLASQKLNELNKMIADEK